MNFIRTLAGAALLTGSITLANAAPVSPGSSTAITGSGVIQVHGNHRSCERGPNGWHRHNKWGQRRACRPWSGQGKRPDFCIKVGKLFYCDY